jgi:rubrerythrin
MTKLFYLSEIVKFAIEKEQESFDLYTKMSEQVSDAAIKSIFQKLAQEETKHKIYYADMLSGIKQEQSPGVKEGEEYQAYMEALIASSRSTSIPTPTDMKDVNKVLDFAIAREKDSVLFYSGLKNLVPANAHDHIDLIIREEERHAAILLKVKAQYK